MHRQLTAILMMAICAAPAAAADTPPGPASTWTSHTYPDLGISIDMPCEPQIQVTSRSDQNGVIPSRRGLCDLGNGAGTLWWVTDYRGRARTMSDEATIEAAIAGAVSGTQSTIDSNVELKLGGLTGREITIHRNDLVLHGCFFLVHGLSVQLLLATRKGDERPEIFERIKASLRLQP